MHDRGQDWSGQRAHCADKPGVTRRNVLAGAAAGALVSSSALEALAQAVPLHCVPPPPGIVPTPFVSPASQPVRARKSAFELSAPEVTRLKAAYAALRRLYEDRPNDPRNWYYQGVVHCWYCSGALDGIWGPEIHGGWFFLPWHRCYLYYHEQILAELINDPTFTLPYWDWDTPGRNRFPPPYLDPPDQTNPLFDAFRAVDATTLIPAQITGATTMTRVLGQATFALFGGAGEGASGQMGSLEGTPHGGVHLWTTNPTAFVPPQVNMGVLGTAAFDPVFFAHHANIDRLWQAWLDTPATPPHANPSEDVWTQQAFVFYDGRRQWSQMAVAQVVDSQASLRYRYQPPTPPGPPVAAGAAAAVAAAPTTPPRSAPARVASSAVVEVAPSGGASLTPDPHTLRVTAPAAAATRFGAMAAAPTQRAVLHIDGVEVPPDRAALVNVFLNRPDATAATPNSDPGFVGSIVLVPNTVPGGHSHRSVQRNFAFDVTDKFRAAPPAAGGELSVTLVPFQGDGTRPSTISLSYKRVYIATE
jgi:polyphenol oxidase